MTETNAPTHYSAAATDERPQSRAGQVSSVTSGLRVGQKLVLIAALFAVPFGVLLVSNLSAQQQSINNVQTELRSETYLKPLADTLKTVQLHRRSASKVLQGDQEEVANLKALSTTLNRLAEGLITSTTGNSDEFALGKDLAEFQLAWNSLRDQVDTGKLSADQSTTRHTRLIEQRLQPLLVKLSNNSQLALDPELATYYLGQLATERLPVGIPTVGITRTLGSSAITAGRVGPSQRSEYAVRLEQARKSQENVAVAARYAVQGLPPADAARLNTELALLEASTNELLGTFDTRILQPTAPSVNADDFKALSTSSTAAQYRFYDYVLKLLGTRLQARESSLSTTRLLYLAASLLVALLAFSGLYLITRGITGSLSRLAGASQRLAAGDLNVQVPVTSRDEVGTVTHAFNGAVTQLRDNEQKNVAARQEASKLQDNIGHFLDVTMNIAEGDLTQRGQVSDDVLGNVVDSINVMVEELGGVLKGVRSASSSVSQASSDMLGTTDQIVRGADSTATETRRVAAQVQGVIAGIREMNAAAQHSAEVARQSLAASEQGREAVLGTLGGMQSIRREVQGVARRIKTLGERSLEIQDIVDTISRLSSQTNLLALNASIEAAGAGAAGSRFAIVADEVRKLADSSAEATRRIASLIRTVQLEISEVVSSVEDGTREVEQGYKVASVAGERLGELGRLAAEAAQFAQAISAASGQQVSRIEEMGSAVSQIGEVAEQSRDLVQQGRAAAERLLPLARQLDDSLARFQLPV